MLSKVIRLIVSIAAGFVLAHWAENREKGGQSDV